jgi:hypothetical protein
MLRAFSSCCMWRPGGLAFRQPCVLKIDASMSMSARQICPPGPRAYHFGVRQPQLDVGRFDIESAFKHGPRAVVRVHHLGQSQLVAVESERDEGSTDRGNSFWLASQLAYLIHAWICGRCWGAAGVSSLGTESGGRDRRTHTFDLVLRMTSSNSCRFLARYSCSSSKSSTRCFGFGGACP